MHIVISISVISFCLVISLTCGIIMWLRRKEVSDRSRLFLAVFNLFTALLCTFRLFTFIANPALKPYHEVLAPFLLTGCPVRPTSLQRTRFSQIITKDVSVSPSRSKMPK